MYNTLPSYVNVVENSGHVVDRFNGQLCRGQTFILLSHVFPCWNQFNLIQAIHRTIKMDNVTIQERPNKGRALIAARNLHAGQTVLSEAPILLTPSIRFIHTICSCCLRYVDGMIRNTHIGFVSTIHQPSSRPTLGTAITCSTCNTAKFCSAACHAASSAPHMHSPWLCRYYATGCALYR